MHKKMFLWGTPLAALCLGMLLTLGGLGPAVCWTASITFWVAVWWVAEPIPIPATSLLPMALFPLVGVLEPGDVAECYGNPMILLMLGGFMLSIGMERSGAHRRIALLMVSLCGAGNGRRLVLGFMLASGLLSMWISNAATTLMLLSIGMAIISQTDNPRLKCALLLGIAYAASVGGIGTPVGTPPNLIFFQVFEENTGLEPTFLEWMSWTLPVVFVMLPTVGFWLTRGLGSTKAIQLPEVGAWRAEEVRTLTVFGATAVLWVTRLQPFGGWSGWLSLPGANDASVALLGVLAMFVIPSGSWKESKRLLDWESARQIPWGILLLFSGGICIAKAFVQSGLSELLGQQLAAFGAIPLLLLVGIICLAVTFLTELTSNTATTTLLLPILAAAAINVGIEPLVIMVPATISASFAFMLPVATAPNAIVFGSNELTVKQMVREGVVLNLIGVVVVTAICYWRFS
ncbi:MAG: SLC13 family permease [Mariniblastus sp.]|nr:SLC13 family permease [Mariniblastus sp.]